MSESTLCRNCGAEVAQDYCPACGQRKHERVTMRYVFRRLLGDLTDVNSGFLFTMWRLTVGPAAAIQEYIDGRRKVYTNPFKYSFILAAAFIAILQLTGNAGDIERDLKAGFANGRVESADPAENKFAQHVGEHFIVFLEFIKNYINILLMLLIPIPAFFTWQVFRNQGLNFAEHLILNAYIFAQQLLLFVPFQLAQFWMARGSAHQIIGFCYSLVSFGYYVWVIMALFPAVPFGKRLWRVVLSFILTMILFSVVLVGAVGLIAIGVNLSVYFDEHY